MHSRQIVERRGLRALYFPNYLLVGFAIRCTTRAGSLQFWLLTHHGLIFSPPSSALDWYLPICSLTVPLLRHSDGTVRGTMRLCRA
jgi:hypothetical protein